MSYTTEEYTVAKLKIRQAMPLDLKIKFSEQRIREWYRHHGGNVYVSFSGGKDSTVLLHLVRELFPDVPAVFVDTGLEYPEIREFVKTVDNVEWLKPEMPFNKVVERYGYPVVSKVQAMTIRKLTTQNLSEAYRNKLMYGDDRGSAGKLSEKWKFLLDAPFKISEQCCDVMKKKPVKAYGKRTGKAQFVGTMAADSRMREQVYVSKGCNSFDGNEPKSAPISFWVEDDIWEYINSKGIDYSKIYDMGEKRTGCMFCGFGCHMEKGSNRFQRMAESHPKQYRYCMENLGMADVLDFIGLPYKPGDRIQKSLFKEFDDEILY